MGAVAACAIALPRAVESAGPAGRRPASGPEDRAPSVRSAPRGDGTARTSAAREASPPGPHLSAGLRCGPALSSPDGIEAQTCVVARGEDVWADLLPHHHRWDAGRRAEPHGARRPDVADTLCRGRR
ncbi:hypothetical protein [Streptomyces marokkonensis]|uniref:hypothetical protein n=1 Tax=Streptomyces marokkonensis TaxID=324855 RepID=UPI001FCB2455|nr:hypothetical protein [Streptomyces marokkonensis]